MRNLDGFRVAALATDGFEESELLEPMKALTDSGARVFVISPKKGKSRQPFMTATKGQRLKLTVRLTTQMLKTTMPC